MMNGLLNNAELKFNGGIHLPRCNLHAFHSWEMNPVESGFMTMHEADNCTGFHRSIPTLPFHNIIIIIY